MVDKHSKATYDAYGDLPMPPARIRVALLGGKFMETVDLDGYSLHELNLRREWRRQWLLERIIEAEIRLAVKIDAENERKRLASGQGLVEYALILALIAIIAIVALVVLGNQISGILSNLGSQIGG